MKPCCDPVSKAKSVILTDTGLRRGRRCGEPRGADVFSAGCSKAPPSRVVNGAGGWGRKSVPPAGNGAGPRKVV